MKALFLASLLFSCSPYSPDLGNQPFACGDTDPKCPDGYDCIPTSGGSGATNLCVKSGGEVIDAGALICADDSAIEPNNSYTMPYVTPVALQRMSITLAGLAICPAGDVDVYQLTTTEPGQNLMATMTYTDSGAPLEMIILNQNGSQIGSGSAGGSADTLTADIDGLEESTNYFVQVDSPTVGGRNNYMLSIAISP